MKRGNIILIILAIVLIGLGAYQLASNKKKNQAETAVVAEQSTDTPVNIATARYEHLSADYSSNGNFEPLQMLSLSSEIPGRIVRVLVKEGDYVKVGQVLATIKKDAVEVENTTALANYQNAVVDNQRYENAYKSGGVTKQQLDMSRLQLKNAKAQLEQSNIRVNDTNVRATINGIINKRHIEPGSIVSPGVPMFDIVNVSKLKLRVNVDEAQVANLRVGDRIKVKASVLPNEEFNGRISFVAPLADASLNFPVEIEVDNTGSSPLKAGMYGTALFSSSEGGQTHAYLTVPKDAFVNGISSNQIFVLNKDNTVKLKTVVTGVVFGDKVQVVSGLNEGERVVTSGQINLVDGAKVRVLQ
ncbi:MAG: efflux RND transporter periplasmic adaptor subunit [Chryseobacterium sp.]|nr:MAG: efflux RND transporter periplasmic adaptor subunit [Chryseobacterium sp.]